MKKAQIVYNGTNYDDEREKRIVMQSLEDILDSKESKGNTYLITIEQIEEIPKYK